MRLRRERRRRQERSGPGAGVGRLKISGVLASEPAGKSLKDCEHGECFVTYDAGSEDQEVRRRFGVTGLRRMKLLRIATEAHEQGIDLTQEDLAYRILNCGLKTIKRDIAYFRKQGLFLPTRGQQKDIGPVLTHQVEAVRMAIEGKPTWEIARRILHPPRAIERYLATFARVVALADGGAERRAAAASLGLSERLFSDFLALRDRYADTEHAGRMAEILAKRPEPEPAREETGRGRLPIYDEQVKVLRREFFQFLLEHEIRRARRYGQPLTFLLIELDGGSRGRPLPSSVLNRALAGQLRSTLRKTDVVGRLGASRFGVIMTADTQAAYRVAERIRGLMAGLDGGGDPASPESGMRATVSVGGASLAAGALDSPEALTEMAATMLSQAREGGGNRTRLHAFPDVAAPAAAEPGTPPAEVAEVPTEEEAPGGARRSA
ncbi:MAG TPA: DUF1670 domain-containing protein [Thermodesulfobacteriota bacterium]